MKRMNSIELSALANQDSKERRYWTEKLSGELQRSHFPYDYSENTEAAKNSTGVKLFTLPDKIGIALEKLSNGSYYRMHMILTSIIAILLNKFTGENDTFLGTTIFRQQQEDELPNTFLPLRIEFTEDMTYKEVLFNIRDTIKEAVENQNYPVERLLFQSNSTSMDGECDYFNIIVLLTNIQDKSYIEHIKYDTLFQFSKSDSCIEGLIEYNKCLYTEIAIDNIIARFTTISELILDNTNCKISESEILSKAEKDKILIEFNNTKAEYPSGKTLNELFEEQVQKTPDSIAAVYENSKLTYSELNKKANQLARVLRAQGIKEESIVGIMVERSLEMLIGILGIWKAGGAYLPIDPEYPEDRIKYMLEDASIKLLLTQSQLNNNKVYEGSFIALDDDSIYNGNSENMESTGKANNTAYIIYTSGSTGLSKGVMVEHESAINSLNWRACYYHYTEDDVTLLTASYSFDSWIEGAFVPLITGGKVVLASYESSLNTEFLKNCILENQVTNTLMVPSLYAVLLDKLDTECLQSMRFITLGGENIPEKLIREHYSRYEYVELYNEYGPTEASICATVYKVSNERDGRYIGKPIFNTKIYILSRDNRIQPVGIPGELCIAGTGVAKGYLNRNELTAEKFVENPFIKGERMYKTGDLARWLPDGNIEFLGRIDYQVKIRGYRIELGEIENRLMKNAAVKEAVVTAKEDDNRNKYLCAYITAEQELNTGELRRHLAKTLPDYMIPLYFIKLEKMPLNRNGKINRKALPEQGRNIETGTEYEAPGNETEKKLAELWQEVLKVDCVGINDNYFELGGHSINAILLIKRISMEFDAPSMMSNIFKYPTIKKYAEFLEQQGNNRNNRKADNVFLLKKARNTDKNLFLIHAGSGEVIAYEEFAEKLNADWNVWGIKAERKDWFINQGTGIEEFASEYIDKIKKIQPEGAYCIGGWCIGGTIAFEIVRQLEKIQNQVELLLLFNPIAPDENPVNTVNTKTYTFTYNTEAVLGDLLAQEGNCIEKLKSAAGMHEITDIFSELIEQKVMDMDTIRSRVPASLKRAIPGFEMIELEDLFYYLGLIQVLGSARAVYIPKDRIISPAHLFAVNEDKIENIDHWQLYSKNHIKKHEVKGDHYTMWQSENVKELAQEFMAIMDAPNPEA